MIVELNKYPSTSTPCTMVPFYFIKFLIKTLFFQYEFIKLVFHKMILETLFNFVRINLKTNYLKTYIIINNFFKHNKIIKHIVLNYKLAVQLSDVFN